MGPKLINEDKRQDKISAKVRHLSEKFGGTSRGAGSGSHLAPKGQLSLSQPSQASASVHSDSVDDSDRGVAHPSDRSVNQIQNSSEESMASIQDGNNDDDLWVCKMCKGHFPSEKDQLLECEVCQQHCCAKCLGLTKQQYNTMQRNDLVWICSSTCKRELTTALANARTTIPQINQLIESINKVEEDVEKIRKFTTQPENVLDEHEWPTLGMNTDDTETAVKQVRRSVHQPITKGIVKEAIEETERENQLKEERARNVIIFRAKELPNSTKEQQAREDKKFIADFCKLIEVPEVDVTEVTRLGKRTEEKVRPLRFRVKDSEQKGELMKNLNRLKDADKPFSEIQVSHDLTINQRTLLKSKIDEAKKMTDESTDKTWVYKARCPLGPHWDVKIVRLRARQRTI